MSTYRRFKPTDLFDLNYINLDKYTENYGIPFYLTYFMRWPEYNQIAISMDGKPIGYVMGKSEGEGENWHGHVTALTVAPDYRRLGIGNELMRHLESVSEKGDMYFVDLFVRESNYKAIQMYNKLGYTTYRTITGYYSGQNPENGLDMRKPLPRDYKKDSLKCKKPVISVEELFGE